MDTPVFINNSIIHNTPKGWKQAIDERMDKQNVVYIQSKEYYSVFKRNVVLTHATAWGSLEDRVLTEISQHKKTAPV